MPSKAFVVDQAEGALGLRTNQRTEMLKLALPAGKYALIASGTAECAEHRSVICFIETTTTTVARGGVTLLGAPVFFVPVPPLFGVLSLAAADTVRVNCMVNEFTPGDAAGLNFRLMVWSVDAIG
jgi:hypothetical protein